MTSRRKVIAVTGTIGSGKSTAGDIFQAMGADVLDADYLARQVVLPDTFGLKKIQEIFGSECIKNDGTLDRKWLAEAVFTNLDLLTRLNQIVHPLVQALFTELVDSLQKKKTNHPIIYHVPLLFEANVPLDRFDETITISVNPVIALERATRRDAASQDSILRRMAAQFSNEEKCRRSTIVIPNNGTIEELKEEILKIYPDLLSIKNAK